MAESRRNGAPEAGGDAAAPSAADIAPLSRLQTLEEAVLRLDALVKQQEAVIAAMRDRPSDPLPRFLAIAATVLSAMALLVAFVQ
jgi:hypothetical protein